MIGMGSLRVRILVVIIAAVLLNVVGMLRYPGGPLRASVIDDPLWLDLTPAADGWGVESRAPDWPIVGNTIYVSAQSLTNPWPWAATVESVTPLNLTGGLVVDRILIGAPGSGSAGLIGIGPEPVLPARHTMEELYSGVPATVSSGITTDLAMPILLVLHGGHPGPTQFDGLAIDYRVGPFTFRVVEHMRMAVCIWPPGAGEGCPST